VAFGVEPSRPSQAAAHRHGLRAAPVVPESPIFGWSSLFRRGTVGELASQPMALGGCAGGAPSASIAVRGLLAGFQRPSRTVGSRHCVCDYV
jgi:hypothetical protein